METLTVEAVLKFVHEQRAIRGADKVMPKWSDAQIVCAVASAICNNTFGWITTGGKISGFAFGFPRPQEKVLDITQVLCVSPRDLAHLLLMLKQVYPGWSIRGFRKKKSGDKSLCDYSIQDIDRMIHLSQVVSLQKTS
jgi:hypothetical protein